MPECHGCGKIIPPNRTGYCTTCTMNGNAARKSMAGHNDMWEELKVMGMVNEKTGLVDFGASKKKAPTDAQIDRAERNWKGCD
jgi:hypothetical protein